MPTCDYHSARDIIGACIHCGRSICTECKVELDEEIYCNSCAANKYTDNVQGEATAQENTSGLGSSIIVPKEVRGWNWGAFLLGWIWAIGNKAWIGVFLCLFAWMISMVTLQFGSESIGLLLGVGVGVVLALKGSEWAWQNKRWDSIKHFKRTQRTWRNWGIGFTIVASIIGFIIGSSGWTP
ncbi:hypothetical protein ACFLYX_04185 [Chloroflexota bacterium]